MSLLFRSLVLLVVLAPLAAPVSGQVAFTQRTGSANPMNGVTLVGDAAGSFGDLDNDGDVDLITLETQSATSGALSLYFRNGGTTSSPALTQQPGRPFSSLGSFSRGAIGDIDNDGDLDVVTGDNGNVLKYFENTGSLTSASFTRRTGASNPFDGVSLSYGNSPTLADIDDDGDLDLLVGRSGSTFTYFENTGTAASASFTQRTGVSNPFDGVTGPSSYAAAALVDVDGDGDIDAITGGSNGLLRYYENQGTRTTPSFVERSGTSNPFDGVDVGGYSVPLAADLNADGRPDLLVGTQAGTFAYFENTIPALPEINVTGNGTAISDGDTSPSIADHTDFGSAAIDGGTVTRTFTVQNTGTGPLTLGANAVTITGLNRADFTVTSQPAPSVAASGSATFTIQYDPRLTVAGLRTARVSIASDDADENPYTFQIHGVATFTAPNTFVVRTGADDPLDGYPSESGSRSYPLLGDLDADGDLDLIVGDWDGTADYLENTGTAQSPVFTLRTGADNPLNGQDVGFKFAPALGDLDDDGDLDLLVGNSDGTYNYYENTGTAQAPVFTLRAGAANPLDGQDVGYDSNAALGDLDGDGDLDFFSGEFDGGYFYFENIGTAASPAFTQRTGAANPLDGVDLGGIVSAVSMVDLDGDGDLDAMLPPGASLVYFENTGTPASPVLTRNDADNPLADLPAGTQSRLTFGDLDGDGDFDLFMGSQGGGITYAENVVLAFGIDDASPAAHTVSVARDANVSATFSAALDAATVTTTTFAVRGRQSGLIAGALSVTGSTITFDPTQDFLPGEAVTVTASSGIESAAGTNLTPYSWQFSVQSASGPGTFGGQSAIQTLVEPADLYSADLDGDGDVDVIVPSTGNFSSSYAGGYLAWYENDGSGGFVENVVNANHIGITSVHAADINGDGNIDIVAASARGSVRLAWYAGDGSGAFGPAQAVTSEGIDNAISVDVDGDGDLDLIGGERTPVNPKIWLLRNQGGGTFAPLELIASDVTSSLTGLASADLDGDGDMDLISTSSFDDKVAWYENDGSGGYGAQQTISSSGVNSVDNPLAAYAADMDGDGDVDVLVSSSSSGGASGSGVLLYENDGAADLSFTGRRIGSTASTPTSVYAADVDGDGDVDVLSASSGSGVVFHESDGAADPSFTPRSVTVPNTTASSVYPVDVDGDGDLDVFSASSFPNDGTIAWYEQVVIVPPTFSAAFSPASVNVGQTSRLTFTIDNSASTLAASSLAFRNDLPAGLALAAVPGAVNTCGGTLGADAGSGVVQLSGGTVSAGAACTIAVDVTPSQVGDLFNVSGDLTSSQGNSGTASASLTVTPPPTFALTDADPTSARFDVARSTNVSATFDAELNQGTANLSTFTIHGSQTGKRAGTFSFPTSSSLSFDPTLDYLPGEVITVTASGGVQSAAGASLTPFTWQFHAAAAAGSGTFAQQPNIATGVNGAYSVTSADFDGDGDLDAAATSFSTGAVAWY